jgi:hypothetical protein
MSMRFEHATFTAKEVEELTGRSVAQQKNDRRAGYADGSDGGWVRANPYALAQSLVMQALAERGVPPATAHPIAKSASTLIILRVFSLPGAVDDPADIARGEEPVKADWEARTLRYLVVTGKEQNRFCHTADVRSFFEDPPLEDADLAAVIVLDLWRLAELLLRRAGKPLTRAVAVED